MAFRGADALSRHLPVEVLVYSERKRRRPIARSFSVAARAAVRWQSGVRLRRAWGAE